MHAEGRKILREPDAGNPPVRFDEGELNGRLGRSAPYSTNTYGLGLTVVGALAGAWMASKMGLRKCLLIFGTLQAASNAGYLLLARNGAAGGSLLAVISIENLCGGLVTAGFSIYVMAQCDRRYSAFQFALLTSAMALANFTLAPAGWLADRIGWSGFFIFTILAAIPGMAMLIWLPPSPVFPASVDETEPDLALSMKE